MSLREYNRKRKFDQTPEPPGKAAPRKGDLRYVIQLHRATRLHYDFRLEMGGSFKSWAVPRGPSLNPNDQRLAVFVEDHPIAYGSFEGIIPKGNYGAGTVMIWDHGTYRERGHLEDKSAREGEKAMLQGLDEGHITFVLNGEKLQGEFALVKLKKGEERAWLLVKKRDEHSTYKIQKPVEDRSAVTGRTMSEIAAQAEGQGAVWISKREGGGNPKLQRLGKPKPKPKSKPKPERKPERNLGSGTLPRRTRIPLTGSLSQMPRRLRPMEARQTRAPLEMEGWYFTPLKGGLRTLAEVDGRRARLHSKKLLDFTRKYPKIVDALEAAGLKALLDGEITRDGKHYRIFDVLHVNGEDLRDLPLRDRLARLESLPLRGALQAAEALEGDGTPYKGGAVLARNGESAYRSGVDPEWIEIRAGAKAAAAPPQEVGTTVFTHLDKLYWKKEGLTKGDLIDYYRSVAPVLLPHLVDRPLSLNRFPNGIEAQGFYQKDITGYKPRWMKTHRIYSETAGKSIDYALCQNENTLLYLANLGCIEMNPWFSRIQNLERPDFLVIDLDPDEQSFEQVVQIALETRKILDAVGAESFCKTSGATGMHICVPIGARYEFELAREFAEAVCHAVQLKHPAMTTLERNPARRGGRMYLDFMQNRIGQTLASPYSVRPRPGAPVSTPLAWSEVTRKLDPTAFTIHNTLKRIEKRGDLWAPLLKRHTNVASCLKKLRARK